MRNVVRCACATEMLLPAAERLYHVSLKLESYFWSLWSLTYLGKCSYCSTTTRIFPIKFRVLVIDVHASGGKARKEKGKKKRKNLPFPIPFLFFLSFLFLDHGVVQLLSWSSFGFLICPVI